MPDETRQPRLESDQLRVWGAMATLLEWLPAALDAQLLRDSDITHFDFGLMYALAEAPDSTLRMSTLAGYSNSSLSRLSRAATRLETRGWVHRSTDPSDGRYTLAHLTGAGREKVDQASPGHLELVCRVVFGSLTQAQVKQLGEISTRITSAIRPDGNWQASSAPDPTF